LSNNDSGGHTNLVRKLNNLAHPGPKGLDAFESFLGKEVASRELVSRFLFFREIAH
jgi:hypothetical protein